MKNKFYFVLSAFIVPFMMIGCNSNKNDVTDIKVELKDETRELQVGQTVNKSDFNVTVTFKNKTTKELKENEWTSDTTFPYVLNYKDRNAGHTVFNVKYNKTTKDSNVFVAPYFEFDYLTIGWNDTVAFDVPLYETASKNEEVEVTYKIYDDSKDVITFDDDTKPSNKIKLKKAFTEAQKDAFLYVELKDGTLLDGCTIRANTNLDSQIKCGDDGLVTSGEHNTSTELVVPSVINGFIARKTFSFRTSFLKSLYLPNTLNEILKDSLVSTGGEQLESINIPDGVTSIGEGALKKHNLLSKIDISKNSKLKYIGNNAFDCSEMSGNNILEEITFPDSLEEIGNSAFNGFLKLEKINITNNCSLKFIGADAFKYCENLEVEDEDTHDKYLKANVDGGYNEHFILNNLNKSSECYVNEKCKIVNVDSADLKDEYFSLPEGVVSINRNALASTKLSKITLPSTVTAIGKGALANFNDKTIKFANYDGWYYVDKDKVQTVSKEVLEKTAEVVELLQEHDLLRN